MTGVSMAAFCPETLCPETMAAQKKNEHAKLEFTKVVLLRYALVEKKRKDFFMVFGFRKRKVGNEKCVEVLNDVSKWKTRRKTSLVVLRWLDAHCSNFNAK